MQAVGPIQVSLATALEEPVDMQTPLQPGEDGLLEFTMEYALSTLLVTCHHIPGNEEVL